MLTSLGSPAASSRLSTPVIKPSPARYLITLALLIFFSEIVAMAVLYILQIPNYVLNTLLDGIMMLGFIMPGLYFLQLKPILRHMADQNQAEQALKTSEELFRKVLELLPVGVGITDKAGKFVHDNPASQQIWGGVRYVGIDKYEEYKGWWANTGKRIKAEEWAAARAIIHGETTLNEEVEIESFDGIRKIILNSALPILDKRGVIQGTVIVNQDITRRRKTEKELISKNELLERFFSSIDTLIAYMDQDFNFIRVNDTYAAAGGHPPEFFIGKNHFDLYPHEENQAIFQKVVETGESFSVLEKPFEYEEYPERGITYWDWGLQPVKGVDGVIEGVVLSMVDVTERKLSEIRLERQNQELRELTIAERRLRELAEGLVRRETAARQFAETLSATAQVLSQTLNLEHVINTLLDHLYTILPSDSAGVILLKSEVYPITYALRGYKKWADHTDIPSIPIGDDVITSSVIRRLESARKSLVIPNPVSDSTSAPSNSANPMFVHSWLITPIIASDELIGWVELGRVEDEVFNPEHIRQAEALVFQAAVALQNARLFEQVQSSRKRLQSLAHKLVKVQENERYHIARELHDEAGQALSSLKINLRLLEQESDCSQSIQQQLAEMKGMADSVLEELHRLAMDLRPATLDHLGLVAALEQHINNLNAEKLSVQFKAVGFERVRLVRDVEISLYRIVQETLTNVIRHAHAHTAGILLERVQNSVKLFIEDDGVGFSLDAVEQKDRLGLVGIRERAEMLGGSLTIESSPGKGTSIIVEVPNVYSDPDNR